MSFLQPMLLAGAAADRAADHHPPDQPAPVPDDPLGGDDVPAGGQPDVAGLCPAAAMADHGVADGGDRRAGLRGQPAAGRRLAGPGGGGRADTTIILLDRSPSMQQAGAGAGGSKLETGRRQLVRHARDARLGALGPDRRARTEQAARAGIARRRCATSPEHRAGQRLGRSARRCCRPRTTTSRPTKPGRTEVWICSDLRENDWNADERPLAGACATRSCEFPQGVRFHLLAYPQTAPREPRRCG